MGLCKNKCLYIIGAVGGVGYPSRGRAASPYENGYTYCRRCEFYYPEKSGVYYCQCCGMKLRRNSRNHNRRKAILVGVPHRF